MCIVNQRKRMAHLVYCIILNFITMFVWFGPGFRMLEDDSHKRSLSKPLVNILMNFHITYVQPTIYITNAINLLFFGRKIVEIINCNMFKNINQKVFQWKFFTVFSFVDLIIFIFCYIRWQTKDSMLEVLTNGKLMLCLILFHKQYLYEFTFMLYPQFLLQYSLKCIQNRLIQDINLSDIEIIFKELFDLCEFSQRINRYLTVTYMGFCINHVQSFIFLVLVPYINGVHPSSAMFGLILNTTVYCAILIWNKKSVHLMKVIFEQINLQLTNRSFSSSEQMNQIELFSNYSRNSIRVRCIELSRLYQHRLKIRLFNLAILDMNFFASSILLSLNYLLLIIQTYQ